MTDAYESLQNGPQTGIHKPNLSVEERMQLRRITISGTSGFPRTNISGRFTSVSYLEGDERDAAALFVEENRDHLEQIDFSKPNAVQRSLSQEIYDWTLHELGVRKLDKTPNTVREYRPEEDVTWIMSRGKYENAPSRRYSTGGSGSAKLVDITLEYLYSKLPTSCTLSDLPADATGDTMWIFAYFDESPEYNCTVTPTENGVTLIKHR